MSTVVSSPDINIINVVTATARVTTVTTLLEISLNFSFFLSFSKKIHKCYFDGAFSTSSGNSTIRDFQKTLQANL